MIGSGQRCLSLFITWMGNKVKGIEIISRGYTEGVGMNPQSRGSHSMTVSFLFFLSSMDMCWVFLFLRQLLNVS